LHTILMNELILDALLEIPVSYFRRS